MRPVVILMCNGDSSVSEYAWGEMSRREGGRKWSKRVLVWKDKSPEFLSLAIASIFREVDSTNKIGVYCEGEACPLFVKTCAHILDATAHTTRSELPFHFIVFDDPPDARLTFGTSFAPLRHAEGSCKVTILVSDKTLDANSFSLPADPARLRAASFHGYLYMLLLHRDAVNTSEEVKEADDAGFYVADYKCGRVLYAPSSDSPVLHWAMRRADGAKTVSDSIALVIGDTRLVSQEKAFSYYSLSIAIAISVTFLISLIFGISAIQKIGLENSRRRFA
jgi:hypothetical protein